MSRNTDGFTIVQLQPLHGDDVIITKFSVTSIVKHVSAIALNPGKEHCVKFDDYTVMRVIMGELHDARTDDTCLNGESFPEYFPGETAVLSCENRVFCVCEHDDRYKARLEFGSEANCIDFIKESIDKQGNMILEHDQGFDGTKKVYFIEYIARMLAHHRIQSEYEEFCCF